VLLVELAGADMEELGNSPTGDPNIEERLYFQAAAF
jgi:hypothetical protein